ncbi:hypothetical protein CPB85DRAFT_873792 [Mucidula mucida]|nr:hypothetical protein CPB85DRAFT_873792 [Mucidula mucida]
MRRRDFMYVPPPFVENNWACPKDREQKTKEQRDSQKGRTRMKGHQRCRPGLRSLLHFPFTRMRSSEYTASEMAGPTMAKKARATFRLSA